MNATDRARAAYRPDNIAIRTPSAIEHEAFMRVTRRLTLASGPGTSFPEIATALYENRRLWGVLAASVADPENALSSDIRARILFLADFTYIHSQKVLFEKASIDPLIDINSAMMAGLRKQGAAA